MSLSTLAKRCIANQSKFEHLNAFISRVDEASVLEQLSSTQNVSSEPSRNASSDPSGSRNALAGSLAGHLIAIKDNICTTSLPTTAASGILQTFTSPYDATVITQLRSAGAIIAGKTNMDEFGMGSHSTNSFFGTVKRTQNNSPEGVALSSGGSSGGSAVAVATGQCTAALGTDTGGSVRLPAAYSGVVGFKPSYGLVSRWGVIAYANSLDCVGVMGREVRSTRAVFERLNVWDEKDPTSLGVETRKRIEHARRDGKDGKRGLRIGIPKEYNIDTLAPEVRKSWIHALRLLAKERGHTLHSVSLPATRHALSAYYILAPAEASSNLAKYDGVRFGTRAPGIDGTPTSTLFAKTRGAGFGDEVQRRILLGAFSLSADAMDNYFMQAQRIRRLVQSDFNSVFSLPNPLVRISEVETGTAASEEEEGVDVILVPTAPTPPPTLESLKQQTPVQTYMNDVFTVPASLAGLPAVSVPVPSPETGDVSARGEREGTDGIGMQIIGQFGDDGMVLDVAEELEGLVREDLRRRVRGGR